MFKGLYLYLRHVFSMRRCRFIHRQSRHNGKDGVSIAIGKGSYAQGGKGGIGKNGRGGDGGSASAVGGGIAIGGRGGDAR